MSASIVCGHSETIEAFVRRLSQMSRETYNEVSGEFNHPSLGAYSFKVRPSMTQKEILDAFYSWSRNQEK